MKSKDDLICGVGIMFGAKKRKPIDIIESKAKIKLTSSSSVINFMQDSSYGGFTAKISLDEQNMEEIKEQLNGFFGGTAPSKATKSLPNFQNTCPWWDLDEKNIEAIYRRFVDEKKFFTRMSHDVWAFISKDQNGQRYLYIVY